MSELKVFREKTISRIIDKRRETKLKKIHDEEEDRKQTNAFRKHWLHEFKQKRSREIVEAIDHHLVASSIPDVINDNKISFRSKKLENENKLRLLTTGLTDNYHDNLDIKRNSGQFTMAIEKDRTSAQFEFRSDEKKSLVDEFLRNAVASGLKKRLKTRTFLYELSGNAAQAMLPSGNYNASSSSSSSNRKNVTNSPSNELQINELLKELCVNSLGDNSPRKRLIAGHMKRLLVLAQRSNWSEFRLTSDPQNRNFSQSIDGNPATTSSAAAGRLNGDSEKTSLFRSALVDGCYLMGPDKRSILEFIRSRRAQLHANDDSSYAGSNAGSSTEGRRSVSSKNRSLEDTSMRKIFEAQVLYNTSGGDDPPEMLSLLPSYCFPIGVEVSLIAISNATNKQSSGSATAPLNSIISNSSTKKTKKKVKVFFPSDFTIDKSDPKVPNGSGNGNDERKSMTEKVMGITSPALSSMVSTFVLLLGDHSNQRYCLGIQIPVTFTDAENGITVETFYTLCVLTRFPFYSYFFYTLFKIDEEKKLFSFHEPLTIFDPNFPVHPNLKAVDELITKLRKIHVPIFPYFILERTKPSVENINTSTDLDSYFSYLPNIKLSMKLKSAELEGLEFHRSFYQRFFSNIGHPNSDEDNDLLASAIRLYERNLKSEFNPTISHKLEKDKEDSFYALQWALPTLLRHLPLDQIILALGCAIAEMNIIVKHREINVISSIIIALMHLLKPLKWCSPVIVSLPEQLSDAMESPVPIIIGVLKLPTYFVLLENCVVIDPTERIVHLNPNDVVKSHTILLPSASRVVHALRPSAEVILRYARKQRTSKYKKISVNQSFYVRNAGATSVASSLFPSASLNNAGDKATADNASAVNNASAVKTDEIKSLKLNVPIELSITTADCSEFLGEIKKFSGIISNHILAIVNTAIQLQIEEKLEAKKKRRVINPMRNSARQSKQVQSSSHPRPNSLSLSRSTNQKSISNEAIKTLTSPSPTAVSTTVPAFVKQHSGSAKHLNSVASTSPVEDLSRPMNTIAPLPPPSVANETAKMDINELTTPSEPSHSRSPKNDRHSLAPATSLISKEKKKSHLPPFNTNNVTNRSKTRPNYLHTKNGSDLEDNLMGSPHSIHTQPTPLTNTNTNMNRPSRQSISPISNRRQPKGKPRPLSVPRDFNQNKNILKPKHEIVKVEDSDNKIESANQVKHEDVGVELEKEKTENRLDNAKEDVIEISNVAIFETMSDVTASDVFQNNNADVELPPPAPPAGPPPPSDEKDEKMSVGPSSSVNASISSGSSSLPSLASDAPVLAMKDIGQSGQKFLRKLMDTQMYSNYCQWNRSSLIPSTPSLDGSVYRLPGSPMIGAPLNPINPNDSASPLPTSIANPQPTDPDEPVILEKNVDSLVELLGIALTGTLPLDAAKIQLLQEDYKALYPNTRIEIIKETLELCNSIDLIRDITHRISRSSHTLRKYIDRKIYARYDSSSSELRCRFSPDEFQVCNGLLCHGYCNTTQCSEICIRIWEKKVQNLRHKQAAFNIISKKYEKHGQGDNVKQSTSHSDLATSKIEFVTNAGVRLEAVKHYRETPSQYHLRKQVISTAIKSSSPEGKQQSKLEEKGYVTNHKKKKIIPKEQKLKGVLFSKRQPELNGDETNRLKKKTFAHTSDPYLLALAKHFIKKEDKYNRKYRHHCLQRIRRLCRKFIVHFRKIRYHRSLIYIQAIVRGYIVRNNLELLVETLLERKTSRFMAGVRIRNFVRNHADNIIRYLDWKIEEEAKKRRAVTSIPVAMSATSPNSSTYNSVSNKQVGIAGYDRHIVASGSSAPNIRSPKYINEPSLDSMHRAVSISAATNNSRASLGLPPTPKAVVDSVDTLPPRSVTDSEVHPMAARRSTLGILPDRAREFLQFGKIVRKSPLTITNRVTLSNPPSLNTSPSSTPKSEKSGISFSSLLASAANYTVSSANSSPSTVIREYTVSHEKDIKDEHNVSGQNTHSYSEQGVESMFSNKDLAPLAIEDSRREMVNAVMSPTSFPQIDAEYIDSGDEAEDGKNVEVKTLDRVLAFKRSRQNRFSRRFSADQATSPELDNSKSDDSGAAITKSTPKHRVSRSDGNLTDSCHRLPFISSLDMTKVRVPLHIARISSREGSKDDPMDCSSTVMSDRDERMSVRSASHQTVSNWTTATGGTSAGGEGPSDEETVFSSTSAATTNTARMRKSTPLGKFTAANNYAIHNMVNVGNRTSRSSHNGSSPRDRPSVPDATVSLDSKSSDGSIKITSVAVKRFSMGNERLEPDSLPVTTRTRRKTVGGGFQENVSPTEKMIKNSSHTAITALKSPSESNIATKAESNSSPPVEFNSAIHVQISGNSGKDSPLHYTTPSHDVHASPILNLDLSPEPKKASPSSPPSSSRKSFSLSPMIFSWPKEIDKTKKISDIALDKAKLNQSQDEVVEKSKVELIASELDSGDEETNENMSSSKRPGDDITSDLQVYPLKAFGSAASELLNRQQMAIIKRMWSLLRQGVIITKHNKSGAPKARKLFVDATCSKLYWRASNAKTDKGDVEEDDELYSNDEHNLLHPAHPTSSSQAPSSGSMLGNLIVRIRGRRSSAGVGDDNKIISLREILSVSNDYNVSEVFKRSAMKGYFGNANTNLISILVAGRTLDIELDETLWGDLYHGLQIIVQYYQTLLPSRHGSMSVDPDLHYMQPRNMRRDSQASQQSFYLPKPI